MKFNIISDNGAIPKTGRGRRHSVQATNLNKDLEKLKIKETKDGEEDKNQSGTENSNQRKKEMSRTYKKNKANKKGKGCHKEIIGHDVSKSRT